MAESKYSARRAVVALAVGSQLWLASVQASAQASAADRVLAETLYQEAKRLMAEENFREACPKLAESQRLDPGTGTLLNLATCYEGEGKLASAWAEFNEALLAARRDGREDRVEFAEERLRALEPRLPKLLVSLSPEAARVSGIELTLDGAKLGNAAVGVASPVDPGKHTLVATAPGKKPWQGDIELGEAQGKSIVVPGLSDEAETAASDVTTPTASTASSGDGDPTLDRGTARPIPTSVFIAGGVTVALAAGATVTGLMYLSKRGDYDDVNDPNHALEEKQDKRDDASTMGLVSNVLTAGALVGAGVTTFLFLSRPAASAASGPSRRHPQTMFAPWVSPHGAGIGFGGAL